MIKVNSVENINITLNAEDAKRIAKYLAKYVKDKVENEVIPSYLNGVPSPLFYELLNRIEADMELGPLLDTIKIFYSVSGEIEKLEELYTELDIVFTLLKRDITVGGHDE